MHSPFYDIAIVGLGPAGATLARLLDARFEVIALDRKTDDAGGFHKPCGGLLAPDAQKSLARMGLALPVSLLANPQIFVARALDLATGLTRHYQCGYLNLDRHAFDLWLNSLIPSHITVHRGVVCTRIEACPGGYRLRYRRAGQDITVRARLLAGADGANSLIRRTFFPRGNIPEYLAIQQRFADCQTSPFYSCLFDPEITDCYSWGLRKGEEFIFGGAFALEGARAKFALLKEKASRYGFKLNQPRRTEACLVLRPKTPRDFCCGGSGIFLLGEAAGFISPSSLEGFSYAFDSADALSKVLNAGANSLHAAYARATFGLRLKLLCKIGKTPFIYQPALRSLLMRSGIASLNLMRP